MLALLLLHAISGQTIQHNIVYVVSSKYCFPQTSIAPSEPSTLANITHDMKDMQSLPFCLQELHGRYSDWQTLAELTIALFSDAPFLVAHQYWEILSCNAQATNPRTNRGAESPLIAESEEGFDCCDVCHGIHAKR